MTTGYQLKNNQGQVASNGIWQLIETIVIAEAVTTQDFATVLDGDNDGGYCIELNIVNGVAATNLFSLRINAATAVCNRQILQVVGTGVTGSAAASPAFLNMPTNAGNGKEGLAMLQMPFSKTGRYRFISGTSSHSSTGTTFAELYIMMFEITTPTSATNITSLGIVSNQASGIGVGSTLRLYKLINS